MRGTWLLLLPALLLPRPASGQVYRVVDLGVGAGFFPTALNNRGQILLTNNALTPAGIGGLLASGATSTWSGPASIFWDNGHTTPIGLLPGGTNSLARGLNGSGWVVGTADTAAGADHRWARRHCTRIDHRMTARLNWRTPCTNHARSSRPYSRFSD